MMLYDPRKKQTNQIQGMGKSTSHPDNNWLIHLPTKIQELESEGF